MSRPHALVLITLLTLLAGSLTYAFGPYGPIFAGAAGLFAAFGIYFTEPDRELLRQRYTLRPMDDPVLSAQYETAPAKGGVPPWLWRALVVAYALALIVLGFALDAQDTAPQG